MNEGEERGRGGESASDFWKKGANRYRPLSCEKKKKQVAVGVNEGRGGGGGDRAVISEEDGGGIYRIERNSMA